MVIIIFSYLGSLRLGLNHRVNNLVFWRVLGGHKDRDLFWDIKKCICHFQLSSKLKCKSCSDLFFLPLNLCLISSRFWESVLFFERCCFLSIKRNLSLFSANITWLIRLMVSGGKIQKARILNLPSNWFIFKTNFGENCKTDNERQSWYNLPYLCCYVTASILFIICITKAFTQPGSKRLKHHALSTCSSRLFSLSVRMTAILQSLCNSDHLNSYNKHNLFHRPCVHSHF